MKSSVVSYQLPVISCQLSASRLAAAVAIAALLLSLLCGLAEAQGKEPESQWFGVYLAGSKLGYVNIQTSEVEFRGKPALRAQSEMHMNVGMFGVEAKLQVSAVEYRNLDGSPRYMVARIVSSGHADSVEATYTEDKVSYVANKQGVVKTETLKLPEGGKFMADPTMGGVPTKLAIGDYTEGYFFEPQTLKLLKCSVHVEEKEMVETPLTGEVEAYKVKVDTPLADSTMWATKDGRMLKVSTLLGISMVAEPEKTAKENLVVTEGEGGESVFDFADATAVVLEQEIENPRQVRKMTLDMGGFSKELSLADGDVQSQELVKKTDDRHTYRFEVTAKEPQEARGARLPISDPSFEEYLASSMYVLSDDDQFKRIAAEVAGDEKDVAAASRVICGWVHNYMKPTPEIGLVRNARDIYNARKGVCRDYATLHATIARAAGIPTKVCVGLCYWEGRFYYHAWVESWMGEWIAQDPMLGDVLCDAARIKLSEGDITSVFDVMRDFGSFEPKLISYE